MRGGRWRGPAAGLEPTLGQEGPVPHIFRHGNPGLGRIPGDTFYIAVHTVLDMERAKCAILYGMRRIPHPGDLGEIYEIDILNDSATLVADFKDPTPTNQNSPNGLAYDLVHDLLYFSASEPANAGQSDLYSVAPDDLSPATIIDYEGTLDGESGGATFGINNDWYVINDADELQQVAFHSWNAPIRSISPLMRPVPAPCVSKTQPGCQ